MKKQLLLILALLAVILCSCSENIKSGSYASTLATEPTILETTVPTTPLLVYYPDDDDINTFLNLYNDKYPDNKIEENDIRKYYHHGREHDNQIKYLYNDFDITISSHFSSNDVIPIDIFIENSLKGKRTVDEFKDIFVQFIRVYPSITSDDEVEEFWNLLLEDSIHTVEYKGIRSSLNMFLDTIEYITINK